MDANEDSIRVGGWILTPDPETRTRNAGTRFEQAEALRRFAEARTHEATIRLHDDAQRKAPPHLDALESDSGMAISTRTGNLITHAGLEAAVEHIALVQSVSAGTAERFLNRAETLATDLPEVLEALAAGSIGGPHVDAIADQALRITPRTIPAPDASDPAAVEAWLRAVAAEERAAKDSRSELGLKLLAYADGKNPASVRAKGKSLLEKYDPESFSKRSKKTLEGRFFRIEPGGDGLAYLTVALEAAKAEAIFDRVHSQALALKKDARELDGDEPAEATAHSAGDMPEEGDEPPEVRTMDQLRTDVFSDHMLVGPHGSGLENVQPHVTITIPVTLLPGLRAVNQIANGSDSPSAPMATPPLPTPVPPQTPTAAAPDNRTATSDVPHTRSGGLDDVPLPPGADVPTAQRLGAIDEESAATLMAQAPSWWRILTDPFDGAIIDWAHERYRPTPAQRRALTHRDHTCRTPGCHRPAVWCEPDHTVEWQHGGTTDLNNLALLCKRCHRLKSLGILTMEQLPNGTLLVSTLWDTTRKSTPEAAWATPMGAVEYLAKAAEADVEGSSGGKDASPAGDEADLGEDSWDPWDGPAPQPDPETIERSNAELIAWAAKNLEWPVADPNEDLAALRRRDQAERTREYLDAQRQVEIDSYESLGGDDYPWLMAELYMSDHTPEQDPTKPRRSTARHVNPSRPRIRAMRKRRPLLSADGGTPRASTHRATARRVNAEGVAPLPDDDPPPF